MLPILAIKQIDKSFPGVKALDQASLNVYAGEVMALMGENGAGKSTLMKVLTGIYTKDSGAIFFNGVEQYFTSPRQSQQAGISIIHQELNLIPQLSIAENIFLGREPVNALGKIDWQQMYSAASKLLDRLKVKNSPKQLVSELSLGVQQMVEIAKALSFAAKVIIMDEPTDALTDTETEALFNVIRELKQQNCGIVYISHRLEEIFKICDKVTVLRDGKFINQADVALIDEDALIEMMVGRRLDEQYPRIERGFSTVKLEVKNLTNKYIDNISFNLHKGEILGVSGLMGAGRTELMQTIYGALSRKSGAIILNGVEQNINSPAQGLAAGIAYISEDRKGDGLILGLSVKENMSLCALKIFSNLFGINKGYEAQAIDDYIKLFNIKTPSSNQIIGNLSGGNQQKVAIAKGLLTRPQVLILDEPTRGVDVGAKKEIYELINKFKQDGMSIILVSSEMPEILGMSDRILVMHEGKISGEFNYGQASQEKLLACAIGKNTVKDLA